MTTEMGDNVQRSLSGCLHLSPCYVIRSKQQFRRFNWWRRCSWQGHSCEPQPKWERVTATVPWNRMIINDKGLITDTLNSRFVNWLHINYGCSWVRWGIQEMLRRIIKCGSVFHAQWVSHLLNYLLWANKMANPITVSKRVSFLQFVGSIRKLWRQEGNLYQHMHKYLTGAPTQLFMGYACHGLNRSNMCSNILQITDKATKIANCRTNKLRVKQGIRNSLKIFINSCTAFFMTFWTNRFFASR